MVVDEQKRENNLQGSSFLAIDRIDSRFLIKCHLKTVKSTILWGKSNYVYCCRFHTLCATLDRNVRHSKCMINAWKPGDGSKFHLPPIYIWLVVWNMFYFP
jgi:hypothetical protein